MFKNKEILGVHYTDHLMSLVVWAITMWMVYSTEVTLSFGGFMTCLLLLSSCKERTRTGLTVICGLASAWIFGFLMLYEGFLPGAGIAIGWGVIVALVWLAVLFER